MPTTRPSPRVWLFAATLLAAGVGVFCVWTSRDRLSATFDESLHVAVGLEWWQYGTYTWWPENPPLGRAMVAMLPYRAGARLPPRSEWDPRHHPLRTARFIGLDVLHSGDGYEANLHRARSGTFPFFLVTLVMTWVLAYGYRRPAEGLIAVGFVATLPLLLAHSELATTDVIFTGMFLIAVAAGRAWLHRPSRFRAIAGGAAFAAALLSKFTTLALLPPALLAIVAARAWSGQGWISKRGDGTSPGRRVLLQHAAIAAVAAALTVWAGYRFALGDLDTLVEKHYGSVLLPPVDQRGPLTRALLDRRWPAHALFHGLLAARAYDRAGHTAYLLGRKSEFGFRSFYPIGLLAKTPLPFLIAMVGGFVWLVRCPRSPETAGGVGAALAAAGMLAVSLSSRVNTGVRHVLPVLPLLAVTIAAGAGWALRTYHGRHRWGAALFIATLMGWQAAIAVSARPNHLGYFNELVADPGAVLLTSDLDWGQGLLQLRDEARRRNITTLKIAYHGINRLCDLGLPALEPLAPGPPATGWIAVSENFYRERSWLGLSDDPCIPTLAARVEVPPHPFAWLVPHRPIAVVGSSIRLYHIPEPPGVTPPPR